MTQDPLVQKVAARFAAEGGGSEEFIKAVESHLNLQGRRISFRNKSDLGGGIYDSVWVNFINLPTNKGQGGAESENNRMSFQIDGFGKETPHSPPPTGKVKIEMRVSALPREYKLRGKTGTPAQVAKYLADFLNKVVKEVPPHFTHTRELEKGSRVYSRHGRLTGVATEDPKGSQVEVLWDGEPKPVMVSIDSITVA